MLAPKMPGSPEAILADNMSDEKKIKILTDALGSLRDSVRSMKREKNNLEKRVKELNNKVEAEE